MKRESPRLSIFCIILSSSISTFLSTNTYAITSIPGIQVGHCARTERPTGATVILTKKGVTAGVDVRGGAPGTKETDLLNPVNENRKVNAIVLSGGSAFGLDTATGVMRYLEEKGYGYDVGIAKVPLVPAAALFDLPVGDPKIRPDADCGYRAAAAANSKPVLSGNVGAGLGATVGKLQGWQRGMKSGLGTASIELDNGLKIAAIIAVNSLGDVIDPKTNRVIAGVRSEDGKKILDARTLVRQSTLNMERGFKRGGNTAIGVVATNAVLSRAEATKLAQMAQSGLVRTVAPIHTQYDGDTIFALATGDWKGNANMAVLGELAAQVLAEAVVRATCAELKQFLAIHQRQSLGGAKTLGTRATCSRASRVVSVFSS
jgi:L-aminopeptidase/D-esterase-like protein